jgi:hypothetical protein
MKEGKEYTRLTLFTRSQRNFEVCSQTIVHGIATSEVPMYWRQQQRQFEDVVDCLQVLYPEFDFILV